jgi:hypothetical protein
MFQYSNKMILFLCVCVCKTWLNIEEYMLVWFWKLWVRLNTSTSCVSAESIRSWFFVELKRKGFSRTSILHSRKSPAPETWTWINKTKNVRQDNQDETTIYYTMTFLLPVDLQRGYDHGDNQWEEVCICQKQCHHRQHQPVI